jgi:hypothetical protein
LDLNSSWCGVLRLQEQINENKIFEAADWMNFWQQAGE